MLHRLMKYHFEIFNQDPCLKGWCSGRHTGYGGNGATSGLKIDLELLGCCLVSLHFLCNALNTGPVWDWLPPAYAFFMCSNKCPFYTFTLATDGSRCRNAHTDRLQRERRKVRRLHLIWGPKDLSSLPLYPSHLNKNFRPIWEEISWVR